MKRQIVAFTTIAAALLSTVGCAADDIEGRPPAFPEAIGYTPRVNESPRPYAAIGEGPIAGETAPQSDARANVAWPAPSAQEVAVGADEEQGDAYGDADPAAQTDFHAALDPNGAWVDDSTYGRVWVPSQSVVGEHFTPYVSAGHWAYDDDYTWVSDYEWGWAPFHYGRWVYAGPGWAWIPGRTYSGAWVSWRYGWGDWGYVGWAPLAPTWCWRGGVAVGLGFVPRAPYAFVGSHDLFAPAVGARVIAGPQVAAIASHTRPFVSASPTVGGSGGRGPSPAALNIAAASVVHAPAMHPGLARAIAYAHPSTAVALGARAPQASPRVQPQQSQMARSPQGVSATPFGGFRGASPRGGSQYSGAGSPSQPSHFGGRFGGGFTASASSAPVPAQASSQRLPFADGARRGPASSQFGGYGGATAGTYRSAMPTARSQYYAPAAQSPAAAVAPHVASPSFAPRASAPSGGGAHFGSGGGGGGGGHSGGGGFHGGGGRGGGHR